MNERTNKRMTEKRHQTNKQSGTNIMQTGGFWWNQRGFKAGKISNSKTIYKPSELHLIPFYLQKSKRSQPNLVRSVLPARSFEHSYRHITSTMPVDTCAMHSTTKQKSSRKTIRLWQMQYPTNFTELSRLNKMRKMLQILSVWHAISLYTWDRYIMWTYSQAKRKEKEFHLLYIVTHGVWLPAFVYADLIFALSPSIQDITKHFSVTIYISPAFYNTYFIILSGAFCAHVCGIEFNIGNVLLSSVAFPFPGTQQAIHHWIYISLSLSSTLGDGTFSHSSSGWISFLLPYLIHLPTFFSPSPLAQQQHSLSVQMRRYIWINEFTSITIFN